MLKVLVSVRYQPLDLAALANKKSTPNALAPKAAVAGPVWGNHSPNQRIWRSVGPGLAVDCVECFFQRPGDG